MVIPLEGVDVVTFVPVVDFPSEAEEGVIGSITKLLLLLEETETGFALDDGIT